jgi:hypothetical protein
MNAAFVAGSSLLFMQAGMVYVATLKKRGNVAAVPKLVYLFSMFHFVAYWTVFGADVSGRGDLAAVVFYVGVMCIDVLIMKCLISFPYDAMQDNECQTDISKPIYRDPIIE